MILLAALLAAGARAAEWRAPTVVPSTAAIAEIRIERANVFNPLIRGEDWWGFQIADRIHFITRENVIRRELLFAPGERWDDFKVLESERNLRTNGSFRYAEISEIPRPDGRVDALVRTQDSWTTNPRFSVGTEGGQNYFSYGLQEGNLLGYGKSVGISHSQNGPTRSNDINYGDPRFLGTRLTFSGDYSRSQLGDSAFVSLGRPFYELETENAMSMIFSRGTGQQVLTQDAVQFSQFNQQKRVEDASYGRRLNDSPLFVQRGELGWYAERAQFEPVTSGSPGTLPGTLPANREFSGPTAGYAWIQARYVKETYIDRMERVEDYNLGNELHARGGFMGRELGSDRDRWIYNISDQQGLDLGPGCFLLARAGASGRVAGGKRENELLTAAVNLFWKNYAWSRTRTLVAHLEGSMGQNLDGENQIALGGNNGLRGYKNGSFAGDKSLLLNLEDRFFFEGEWFHLFRLGGAVFLDSGMVGAPGNSLNHAPVKSDIGTGLRVASTRSQSGGVVRLDLAYALNDGPGSSRWVISIRAGQAFSFFNSAANGVATSPASRL